MGSTYVTIHGTGTGVCSLSGKTEVDGLIVSFEDGTVKEAFLSWKGFRQLLSLKSGQAVKPEPKSAAVPVGNGPAVATSK